MSKTLGLTLLFCLIPPLPSITSKPYRVILLLRVFLSFSVKRQAIRVPWTALDQTFLQLLHIAERILLQNQKFVLLPNFYHLKDAQENHKKIICSWSKSYHASRASTKRCQAVSTSIPIQQRWLVGLICIFCQCYQDLLFNFSFCLYHILQSITLT